MKSRHLLIEIGTEELPPKALRKLSEAFTSGITDGLNNADLSFGEVTQYASPRRLAVLIKDLIEAQADKTVERKGPALTAAFNEDGCPSKAAEQRGFKNRQILAMIKANASFADTGGVK